MTRQNTHPIHIFGYGLLLLWISLFLLRIVITQTISGDGVLELIPTLVGHFIFATIILIPIAIVILIISGVLWRIFQRSSLSNGFKATLCAGVSGLVLNILPYASYDLSPIAFLPLSMFLILLFLFCGWFGERLARRHVKMDPNSIPETFE